MINCQPVENRKCLKCSVVPPTLIKVGAFVMCLNCFTTEFGEKVEPFRTRETRGKLYYKWLKEYNKEVTE